MVCNYSIYNKTPTDCYGWWDYSEEITQCNLISPIVFVFHKGLSCNYMMKKTMLAEEKTFKQEFRD
jgi:hypothetical protein